MNEKKKSTSERLAHENKHAPSDILGLISRFFWIAFSLITLKLGELTLGEHFPQYLKERRELHES